MAQVFPFKVDGVEMPCPSICEWGLQDISKADSGRGDDARMMKNRVAQKRRLHIKYNMPKPEVVSKVLKAINPEYFQCTFHDAMENDTITRECYVGDRSAPFKFWWVGHKYFEALEFDIIER